jgi:uncharacterized Fe-S cluster-containing MiaB family protein
VSAYPETTAERDAWILARRPQRNALHPWRPWAFFVEEERSASGEIVPVATVFLTNRECPWRCLMCDLWRNTLTDVTPARAIPAQIDYALKQFFRSEGNSAAGLFQYSDAGGYLRACGCGMPSRASWG